ncbi:MAG: hypothetical protein MUC83_01695 [Pirellula sp.]|jgi:hypothetical protein|nr:hypothetical protein [Pirellula sp.]
MVATTRCNGEEILPIEIVFDAAAQTHPLIVLLDCESSKGDSAIFQSDGLKLEQSSGTKAAKSAGFTFKKSNQGAFQFSVQFEAQQLSAPKAQGAGHGLFVRIIPEQAAEKITTVGFGVSMKNERGFFWYEGLTPKPNQIQFAPANLTAGEMVLLKEGGLLLLQLRENLSKLSDLKSYREIARIDTIKSPVKEIQFLCLKQDSSKPSSVFLVKKLVFLGDEYYSQPPKRPPFFTVALLVKLSVWGLVISCGSWGFYRLGKTKEWF